MIVPGFDLYFIPTVLNSAHPDWIVGLHKDAMKEYGDLMSMEEIVPEGYVILNEECKAAKLTEANTALDIDDVRACESGRALDETAHLLLRIQRDAWRYRACERNQSSAT